MAKIVIIYLFIIFSISVWSCENLEICENFQNACELAEDGQNTSEQWCPEWISSKEDLPNCTSPSGIISEDNPAIGYVLTDKNGKGDRNNQDFLINNLKKLFTNQGNKPPIYYLDVSSETLKQIQNILTKEQLKQIRLIQTASENYNYMRDLFVPYYENKTLTINARTSLSSGTNLKGIVQDTNQANFSSMNCGMDEVSLVETPVDSQQMFGQGGEYVGAPYGVCIISENSPNPCSEENSIKAPTQIASVGHADELVSILPNPNGKPGCQFAIALPNYDEGEKMMKYIAQNSPNEKYVDFEKFKSEIDNKGKDLYNSNGSLKNDADLFALKSICNSKYQTYSNFSIDTAIPKLIQSISTAAQEEDSFINVKDDVNSGMYLVNDYFPEDKSSFLLQKVNAIKESYNILQKNYTGQKYKLNEKDLNFFKQELPLLESAIHSNLKAFNKEDRVEVKKILKELKADINSNTTKPDPPKTNSRAMDFEDSDEDRYSRMEIPYFLLDSKHDCGNITNEQAFTFIHNFTKGKNIYMYQAYIDQFKKNLIDKIVKNSKGICKAEDIKVINMPYIENSKNFTVDETSKPCQKDDPVSINKDGMYEYCSLTSKNGYIRTILRKHTDVNPFFMVNPLNMLKLNNGKVLIPHQGNTAIVDYMKKHLNDQGFDAEFMTALGQAKDGGAAHCSISSIHACK